MTLSASLRPILPGTATVYNYFKYNYLQYFDPDIEEVASFSEIMIVSVARSKNVPEMRVGDSGCASLFHSCRSCLLLFF